MEAFKFLHALINSPGTTLSLNLQGKAVKRYISAKQVRQKQWQWSRTANILSQWTMFNDIFLLFVLNITSKIKMNILRLFTFIYKSDTCATQRNFIWICLIIIFIPIFNWKIKSSYHLQSYIIAITKAWNHYHSSFIFPLEQEYGSCYETNIENFSRQNCVSLPIPINDVSRFY